MTFIAPHAPRTRIRTTLAAAALAALMAGPASAGFLESVVGDIKRAVESEMRDEVREQIGGATGGSSGARTARGGSTAGEDFQRDTNAATGLARNRPLEQPDPHARHVTWDTLFTKSGVADRKLVGHNFTFYCPPAPQRFHKRPVIGGEPVYGWASAICLSAVHAGRMDLNGGNVTLRMERGNLRVEGYSQNGVTSKTRGTGVRSFVFVN
ncbi:MAG: LCCL domain-containing protein [Pseudomonadota bacterium]